MKRIFPFFYLLPCAVFSLPNSGIVKEGNAEFRYAENRLSIACGENSFIEWESFSIDPNEEVHFLQDSPFALTVNRVVSNNLSEIHGMLQANGQILLINSNGVLIGKDGIIDTGSFIASTLDLLHRSKDLHFGGHSGASVINEGSIVAREGDALLIGINTENKGEMLSFNGVTGILGGRDVLIRAADGERIFVRTDLKALVSDLYSSAFSHDLADDALDEVDGFLVCKATNRGSLSSQSETRGGEVYVLGDHVEIGGEIDVSHLHGGGRVFIGGGKQGSASHLANAKKTWIDPEAVISASCLENGHGGNVIIWANESTAFFGRIVAEGGAVQGDGGFIEVSGGHSLSFQGKASTYAPSGKTGTLLLDPNDIVINGGATSGGAFAGAFFDGAGFQPATLNNVELGAALDMNNVLVQTNGPTLGGNGDISFQANVTWTAAGNSLTVSALRDINVLDGIIIAAAGAGSNITFTAGRNIDCRGSIRNNEFATMTGGVLTLTAVTGLINIGNAASLVIPSGAVANIFGAIRVSAPAGDVNLRGGAVNASYAIIGNDNNVFTLAPALSSGNILVESGRDFLMQGGSAGSTLVSVSRLPVPPIGTPAMTNNVVANITINVARDYTMQSGTAGVLTRADGAFVGHGFGGAYRVDNTARSRLGDILVNVGRDLTMTHVQATSVINGDPTSTPFIGSNRVTTALLGSTGFIRVNVGNDLVMRGVATAGRINAPIIGSQTTGAAPPGPDAGNHQHPLYINVGRNFCMDSRFCVTIVGTQNNGALAAYPTEFFIHVGGNMALFGGNSNGTLGVSAQIRHNTASPNMRYQAWTMGSIVCLNGFNANGGGYAELHLPVTFSPAAGAQRVLYDTNVRAGGDIRVAGGTPPPAVPAGVTYSSNGAIFYQANSPFAQGEMWAGQTAIVNGVNIFAGTPLGTPSPTQASGVVGAILFDFQRYDNTAFNCATLTGNVPSALFPVSIPIIYQAHNGQDITMLTADRFATLGTPADLTTGTGNGQISFNTSPRAIAAQTQPIAGGNIRIEAFRNITITGASLTAPAGNILAIANNHLSLISNANITASGSVTLVSDNQAPFAPLIGPGGFTIDDTSQINAQTTIRVFTALPNNPPDQNNISLLALINGQTIGDIALAFGLPLFPGNPFLSDSALEFYCTYYNVPAGNIFAGSNIGGVPFTIFYKPCLQRIVEQATIVTNEFLESFHPYNEFPGWLQRFFLTWDNDEVKLADEPYYFRRRHLNIINHPKTYTILQED
jgi:filamentous hemagglutinin family protein